MAAAVHSGIRIEMVDCEYETAEPESDFESPSDDA